MFSHKHKIVGSLLLVGAAWAQATPSQIFGAEAEVAFAITAPLMAERQRFLALFDNTVQSYGFEAKTAGQLPPFETTFTGSAGSTITATLAGSPGQQVMDLPEVGRYNTTGNLPAGEPGKYWRVNSSGNGEFSISFDRDISAFGFYGTDIGDFGGMLSLVLTPADTTLPLETLTVRPQTTNAAETGVALFYAFADINRAYSKVTFVTSGNLLPGAATDYFGFDDFIVAVRPATYNRVMPISPIPELVTELAAGRMVILVDEEDRENEGDLVLAAEHVTPEAINFMARFARGLICLTLTRERCEHLQLPPMASRNGTKHGTAFTVSIEAATGVTTGISAADRARTVAVAVARGSSAADLVQPGHIFPLQAQEGGVLMRAGHTEAGCDLAGMAGLTPAAVICEIMKDDGTMARLPDLQVFAQEHGLKIGTIADLIGYRSRNETLIERLGARTLVTPQGEFQCSAFQDKSGGLHLALVHGQWQTGDEVPVRVHEPFTAIDLLDTAGSTHSWPLPAALAALKASSCGVAVLLNCTADATTLLPQVLPERRGSAPARAPWDLRTYGVGAQILRQLGVQRMRLLGNPRRMPSMTGYGLEITGFTPAPG